MRELGELILERNHKKIYRHDGVITKVFDHEHYHDSDVLKEAMNQAYARECGLPVPQVYEVFSVGSNLAISSEEIVGKTLLQLRKEFPENEKKYISLLIKIQMELLNHRCDTIKLPKLKDKLNDYISHSGLEYTTRYELHMRLETMPNHLKLCHGDLSFHNIILREDGSYGILDWAHATRGNTSGDASLTYLQFILEDDQKGAEIYLKEFCKKTGIEPSYVNEWISVVSATKLCTVKDEKKRALLEKFINVVEY